MFTPDITIGTNVYSLTAQRTNSSVRSDAAQPVTEPITLTISHETAKNGRRSSVVYLDDTKIVSLAGAAVPVSDSVRAQFKIQYNPLAGRTTLEADLTAAIAEVVAFMSVASNVDKIFNQES